MRPAVTFLAGVAAGLLLALFLRPPPCQLTDSDPVPPEQLDAELGRMLMARQCSKCHCLDSMIVDKSVEEWPETVRQMAEMDAPNISGFDAAQIVYYLTTREQERRVQPAGHEGERRARVPWPRTVNTSCPASQARR